MSGTQWFIFPIGKNQKMLIDTITDELNRRSMCAEAQSIDLASGGSAWAYEVTSQMAGYLKRTRVARGFNFRVYCLNPSSRLAVEDRFIYGGGLKKKPSKKVVKAAEDVQELINKKKKT